MAGDLVFDDGLVQLWCGRFEDVLPGLGVRADLVVADPPYNETSLPWDRWPNGWPALVAEHASSLWVFGSMRMFLDRSAEFSDWKMSQDVVWEKQNGSGPGAADRFMRVHEHATHWYRGAWGDVCHDVPRVMGDARPSRIRERGQTPHRGQYRPDGYEYSDTRLARSVIYAPNMHGRAINPTEKPPALIEPLISYGCAPGGLVLDVFAGSCSTLIAARHLGRRAIGIEMRPEQCTAALPRLEQGSLELESL